VPPTTGSAPDRTRAATSCVGQLSLDEQIPLLVWPAVSTADWPAAQRAVGELGVGGVLLMRPSGITRDELTALLGDLRASSAHGLLVATDEEGGDVQRLAAYRHLPSQREVSTTMAPADAQVLIADHAQFVRSIGVDVVLGPVVDVAPVEGEPPLHPSRFFAGDPDTVGAYASAYVEGWRSAGLLPVLKHFPGHGRASGDTHVGQGRTPPIEALEQWDLRPYRALGGSGAGVMVGHLTVPGLTADVPASTSPEAMAYLRAVPGYADALVISDALGMEAVGADVPVAAVASIAAGVDVVLFTETHRTAEVIGSIAAAVADGRLSPERVRSAADRVLRRSAAGCA
jgi:beta-N-acetylhexosaminidase